MPDPVRFAIVGLGRIGKRHAELIRKNKAISQQQHGPDSIAALKKRWGSYVDADPFCNPNLKRDGSFEIDID